MYRSTKLDNPVPATQPPEPCTAVLLTLVQTNRLIGLAIYLAFLAFFATLAAPAISAAEPNLFATASPECRAPDAQALACGRFGTLFLGGEPRCGAAFRVERGAFFSNPIGEARAGGTDRADAWFPCGGGECFTGDPGGPWVAVVDWDNHHGWSIGETIRQASGFTVETRLFDLERPGLDILEAAPAVGDAHVLAQLCRVAEAAETHPPAAVNLSFGRWAESGCRPGENDLACVIGEVVDHLLRTYGAVTFAAAGNGGDLLYPALDRRILAVGALDVAHLGRTGEARPLPQSPAESAALFPGNGLFLAEPDGPAMWPAPPGSSYASAFAAGWWAAARATLPRRALDLVTGCEDILAPRAEGGRLLLACGPRTLAGSRINGAAEILATALGRRPATSATAEETVVAVEGLALRPLPTITVSEAQARFHRPLPECLTCVPCVVGGSGDGDGNGPQQAPSDDPTSSPVLLTLAGGVRLDGRLEIDLSGSGGVPPEVDLLGVYLQVGRLTFRFSDSENTTLRGELALGRVERLVIQGLPVTIGDAPVSLVYKLRFTDDPDTLFRGSTPILVHD